MRTVAMLAVVALVGCAESVETEPSGAKGPSKSYPTLGPTDVCPGVTAEACANVRSIAEAAKRYFEKNGRLAGSAMPSPATFPAGDTIAPSHEDGQDFQTGGLMPDGTVTADAGWTGLGWKPAQAAVHYQYGYMSGDGEKGEFWTSAVFGPTGDVGPTFEATAQGDLDNDTWKSTFSITGTLKDGQLVLAPMRMHSPQE